MALGGAVSGVRVEQGQVREASMTAAIEQFDPIVKRLEEARGALEHLLDRVFGPHPTPVSDKVNEAPVPSMIAGLNVRAGHLARVVEDVSELVRRLDSVL